MKYLRYTDLQARGIVSNRMTLRRWIQTEGFPAPTLIGPNTIAWPEEEVDNWLAERPKREPRPARGRKAKPTESEAPLRAG
jgi:predicted DNA-binding transcriptional regulator AlpA